MNIEEAVKEYQCSGCVNGPYPDCYKKQQCGSGCQHHRAGTMMLGFIFLGMPKGFNRIGFQKDLKIQIFENYDHLQKEYQSFDKFNITVWKHLDEHGNVLIRGYSPRINNPFLFVILENCLDKINCLEITKEDIEKMD